MENMEGKNCRDAPLKSREKTEINRVRIPKEWSESVVVGLDQVCRFIYNLVKKEVVSGKNCLLALDGYLGAEWQLMVPRINKLLVEEGFDAEVIDIASCYKSSNEIEKIINPLLNSDPFFGQVFDGNLEDFLDPNCLEALKKKLESHKSKMLKAIGPTPKVIICFGCGAANKSLNALYDFVFYVDITREEFINRAQKNHFGFLEPQKISKANNQAADIGLPVHLFKISYYVYYPLLEKYKKWLLSHICFYIDDNIGKEPKLVTKEAFDGILSVLAQYPIRLKPLYVPGPWGGQWIKKTRKLHKSLVNCAWAFEAITPEMSLKIVVAETYLEIPFLTFLLKESRRIMGDEAVRRFDNFFPIRVHYDDSMGGGNMAIQVHPPASYVKKYFNEQIGQDESYYVVLTGPGAKVYLGLKEEIDSDKFLEAVRKAETKNIPFDYDKYVNSIPSKAGDLFSIPAGTVHASGRNELVLEMGNSYGYTFHIYDYLRPDLQGRLRPIHSQHAFQVIKFHRKAKWVNQHLKQQPILIRSGQDWAEYLLGKLREIFYVVHRLEFTRKIDDHTDGKFHILTLVEGEKTMIQSKKNANRKIMMHFSETVIVPACFGEYSILNLGSTQCKVIKVLLK
jgi:mannose-6-phosphate isomerase